MTLAPALRARLWYLLLRTGAAGWLGLGAIVVAVMLAAEARVQLEPANRAAIDELAQLQQRLTEASSPGAALRDPVDAAAAVAGQLPPAEQVPAFIQDVQDRASRSGIQIDRTEYRMQSALGNRALQLQLVMPAHGTYPRLRQWLESLLYDHPSAALDELSLRRQADGAAQLDAHVIFSFYSQAAR